MIKTNTFTVKEDIPARINKQFATEIEFKVTAARTERLKNSAIPYMQRLLNADNMK